MSRTSVVRHPAKIAMASALLGATLFGGASGAVAQDPFDAMNVHRPVEAVPAPDLAFRSLEGREVRLSGLRGKVVLLGFFTTS